MPGRPHQFLHNAPLTCGHAQGPGRELVPQPAVAGGCPSLTWVAENVRRIGLELARKFKNGLPDSTALKKCCQTNSLIHFVRIACFACPLFAYRQSLSSILPRLCGISSTPRSGVSSIS